MLTREVGCTHRLVFLVTNTRTYTRREVLAPPSSYRTRHIRFLETPVLSASFPPLFALYFWRLTTLVPLSSLANPQFCTLVRVLGTAPSLAPRGSYGARSCPVVYRFIMSPFSMLCLRITVPKYPLRRACGDGRI